MKKIYIIFVLMLFLLPSCNDWLDVNSGSETKEEELFSKEEGFKSALTGVYIKIADAGLYGVNMSFYFPELIVQHWTELNSVTDAHDYIMDFNYSNSYVKRVIDNIWTNYYNAIIQVNNILENLETTDVTFTNGNYELIKGECHGLRAFLHLELLRLFGPVPDASASGKTAIPYVDMVTSGSTALLSLPFSGVVDKIEEDFDTAEGYLENDPIRMYSPAVLNSPADFNKFLIDDWHAYRQNRMNYYAVEGLKARLYQWIGDTINANKYANIVINAVNEGNDKKFDLVTESYYVSANDLIMFKENLFGVHNSKHQTVIEKYFKKDQVTLTQSSTNIEAAYEAGLNPSDIRNIDSRYWKLQVYSNQKNIYEFMKYTGNDDIEPINTIPIIRLAEMYLILVENLPLTQAHAKFAEFSVARNLNQELNNFKESERRDKLESEYRKEFYGEGQMFFFYKRFNYSTFTYPASLAVDESVYEIPKPESQTIFE